MKFSHFLREQKEKHAVLAFGRMNPITSGHEKLVNKVKDIAAKVGGSHHIVLSHSQDSKKNPLSAEQKVKHAKNAFPGTNFTAASPKAPTFFDHAEALHKKGVTHLHMVGGSDRTDEYHRLLHKYNGTHEGARFNFKKITVHSAGSRDPDAEGVEGMSASKMREHAKHGDFESFKQGVPSSMKHAHAKQMYNDVRKGMRLHEDIIREGVHDKGIFKAFFLGGGPGSGKDYVLSNTLDGHGMVEINSDKALEYLMDKEGLDKRMPDNEEAQRNVTRKRAKNVTELRQRLALHGRNGLIINGTGDDPGKYMDLKKRLEKLGYDTHMIMVNTKDEISKQRNVERGQRGGRTVPENIRKEKWQAVQDARPQLAKIFRNSYIEYDNSHDLRDESPTDPRIKEQKKKELEGIFKYVQKTVGQPPKHEHAKNWIATELGKKDKAPIRRDVQPHPDAGTHEDMQTNGLEYYGFGRYGKDGKVTHRSLHGRLVPMEKINKTVETHQNKINKDKTIKVRSGGNRHDKKRASKKINEAFDNFLQEKVTFSVTGDSPQEVEKMLRLLRNEVPEDQVEEENDEYTFSDNGAFNLLTLGKGIMVTEETEKKKQKLLSTADGKPRVFHIRMSAAKEAHRRGGEVAKVGNKYVVKLREDINEVFTTPYNATIEINYAQNSSTPSAKELGKVRTNFGRKAKPSPDKPVYEHCGCDDGHPEINPRKKITLSSITKKKVEESIDKGIEPGISMAGAGESLARDMGEKIRKKSGKANPINELTGDETGASIGDQKEDELKKKGISLTTFKKRNYV